MRSVEEGVTAINEGYNVLGFGFMDKEELGQKLVEAYVKTWQSIMKEQYTTSVKVEGKGDSKAKAFASALANAGRGIKVHQQYSAAYRAAGRQRSESGRENN